MSSIMKRFLRIAVAIALASAFSGVFVAPAWSLARSSPPGLSNDQHLSFDIASIRQNKSGLSATGSDKARVNFPIGSDDSYYPTGGVFSATNLPLISYIIFAYKITTNNREALIASVPDWVLTDGYNIDARTDDKDVTKDQMRQMMQALLADRFKLAAHHEQREVPVFAAVLAQPGKLGPQLRKHPSNAQCPAQGPTPQSASPGGKPSAPATDSAGFPVVCGGFANYLPSGAPYHRRFGGGNQSLATIVGGFAGPGDLGRPVVDRTGLIGGYDFFLDYLPDPPPGKELPADASGPNFTEAVRTQLGIKFVRQTAAIDFVIVDHVERPSPN